MFHCILALFLLVTFTWTHRINSYLRPIATDGVLCSVFVSVGHVRDSGKNDYTDLRCHLDGDSGGPKEP